MVSVFSAIIFALLLLITFEAVSAGSPPPPDISMDSLFEFPVESTDFDDDDLLLVPAPSPQTLADELDESVESNASAAPSTLAPSAAPAPPPAVSPPVPNSHSPAPAPNSHSPSNAPNSPSPAPNSPSPAPNSPSPEPNSPPALSPPSPSDDGGTRHETDDSGGLSGGQKAGLAIGVIGAACLIGVGGYVYKKRQENIRRSQFGYRGGIEML